YGQLADKRGEVRLPWSGRVGGSRPTRRRGRDRGDERGRRNPRRGAAATVPALPSHPPGSRTWHRRSRSRPLHRQGTGRSPRWSDLGRKYARADDDLPFDTARLPGRLPNRALSEYSIFGERVSALT